MPVDWDQFKSDLDSIIESGAKRADDRLASRISSVTKMTDEEVKELFPEPADAKKLAGLMKVVNSPPAPLATASSIFWGSSEARLAKTIASLTPSRFSPHSIWLQSFVI